MSVSAGVADIENKIILAEAPKGVLGISVHAAGRLALQQVLKYLERPEWPLPTRGSSERRIQSIIGDGSAKLLHADNNVSPNHSNGRFSF